MKVLITGGAGFIGSHLAERLVSQKYEVTVIDNFESGKLKNISKIQNKIKMFKADIRDKKTVNKNMRGAEVVFHLAAKVTVSDSFNRERDFEEINVLGTLNVLESAVKNKVNKFIFASSAAVYGNSKDLPICEASKTKPISPLGKTKLEAESFCKKYKSDGLDTVILRFFNAYGPQQNPIHGNVVASFLNNLSTDTPPVIYGNGSQTRDFIYIDDVVDAWAAALHANTKDQFIFNVGTGFATPINRLLENFYRIMGKKLKPKYLSARKGDIERSVACICKAKMHLNFNPKTSLNTGLLKTHQALHYEP